jgi:hypothetical protein
MALIPVPTAVLDDAAVACALNRAVRIINPVVDVLSRADPFGFKGRSHHLGGADGSVDMRSMQWHGCSTPRTSLVRKRGRRWTWILG